MSDVQLVEAEYEDKRFIRNLMQFYLSEMSIFGGATPNQHGTFEYRYLDHYWTDNGVAEGRAPFLIHADGDIAGFALKNRWSVINRTPDVSTVAEFFVMSRWRRQGVGRATAFSLFDRFPGPWEVRELRANLPAQHFWRSVIAEYTAHAWQEIDFQDDAWDGPVQLFTTNSP